MKQRHRVERKRQPAPPPVLPRDEWTGGTFREATGTEYEVLWSGAAKHVGLCEGWQRRAYPESGRICLKPNR